MMELNKFSKKIIKRFQYNNGSPKMSSLDLKDSIREIRLLSQKDQELVTAQLLAFSVQVQARAGKASETAINQIHELAATVISNVEELKKRVPLANK